jgi:organic hydroperoxide reductase OsmC/OhrA
MSEHHYAVTTTWTGNRGTGTSAYRAYGREHEISAPGKPPIPGSSDPAFRGDAGRWNPEEMLVSALSTCHMLWYLHLAAEAGVVVVAYEDRAEGTMAEHPVTGGHFTRVVLHPRVTISAGDPAVADDAEAQVGRAGGGIQCSPHAGPKRGWLGIESRTTDHVLRAVAG